MLNKYLKKVLLTTVALFWASCDDTSSVDYGAPEYGCPSDVCGAPTSSPDEVTPSSSSEESASGNVAQSSSSVIAQSSSDMVGSSSDVVGSSSDAASSSSSIDPNSVPSDTLYGVSVTEKTCVPGDSVISYYPPAYSESVARSNAEEDAKHASVSKIDSIVQSLPSVPQCLAKLRRQLDTFVALYGAPMQIHTNEICSDGTTRPTQEYLDYLKMKEEWEANKPALEAESQKIYEDKMKEIEERINKCLATSNPSTDYLTTCDFDGMCPEYGVDSKCTYQYTCSDSVSCWRNEGETNINCTDKQNKETTYTQEEFDKKYYTRFHYLF